MSKKSKKVKKPKFKKTSFLLASEIKNYVHTKFDTDNDAFWDWLFSECKWGETNLLSFDDADYDLIPPKCKEYFIILKNDFMPDADEESCIRIENDL